MSRGTSATNFISFGSGAGLGLEIGRGSADVLNWRSKRISRPSVTKVLFQAETVSDEQ